MSEKDERQAPDNEPTTEPAGSDRPEPYELGEVQKGLRPVAPSHTKRASFAKAIQATRTTRRVRDCA